MGTENWSLRPIQAKAPAGKIADCKLPTAKSPIFTGMKSSPTIYLDYHATTPVDEAVLAAMWPYFREQPGNAASRQHAFGWQAEAAVQTAREQLAALLDADPRELVFTSGATEACNLALKGVWEAYHQKGRHLVTLRTEHKAVLDACRHLERLGAEVTYLEVGSDGRIDLAELEASIRPDTVLVAVMWANNETGVIQPMAEIGELCARQGVLLFSDATQAVGKIPVSPRDAGLHLLACSAHKIYGPKGVGALYLRRSRPRVQLTAQQDGGGHERGMRSGTLNVPGIVGFGRAAELAGACLADEALRLGRLRDWLEKELLDRLDEVIVNGNRAQRLPTVTNLLFRHLDGEALLLRLGARLAVSAGSACTAATVEPSHVLRAMGRSEAEAFASLRFSLGRYTTEAEVERAVELVAEAVRDQRAQNAPWAVRQAGN